ncbi:MAG: phospho-N-acetylmuramoyl-pentapeptide-transferase [Lachnospiraceae bacterium]|nr:phospho-N-acetylmuramoyl-pentapeptide-transferase [Lachnospiraceae bacterium]
MKHDIVIPLFIAFAIVAISGVPIIRLLQRLKARQTVREDGPDSHKVKTGTPTMGGILILAGIVGAAVFFINDYPRVIPIILTMLGFGIIGFLDDYIKVSKKRSLGLRAWHKITAQLLVTAVFAFYLTYILEVSLAMRLPFTDGKVLDFGVMNIPILFLVTIAVINAANLTDGLDGLLGSVTLMVAVFFVVAALLLEAGIAPLAAATVGALLGYLLYNSYPARVMMGDTGSFALGGFIVASAYLTQLQLFIPIIGLVYVLEALSVVIQVGYFKMSGGKRVFKMAPLHHHFELCGWKETKIVAVFLIATALLCILGLTGLSKW